MASVILGITILCATSLFFAFVFGFFAFLRYLKHKEIIALAERGLVQPEPVVNNKDEDSGLLRGGVILVAVGLALCIGLYPIGWITMPGELPLNLGPWMLVGILPLFIGFGLLVIYLMPTLQRLLRSDMALNRNLSSRMSARKRVSDDTISSTPGNGTTVQLEREE